MLHLLILWLVLRQVQDLVNGYRWALELPQVHGAVICVLVTALVVLALVALVDAICRFAEGEDW